MDSSKFIFKLIQKSQRQTLTAEEQFILDVWYETQLQDGKEIFGDLSTDEIKKLEYEMSLNLNKAISNRSRVIRLRWISVAASLLVVFSISWLIYQNHFNNIESYKQVENYTSVRTLVGEMKKVNLSDGSKIILKPNSLLKIYAGYGKTSRRIFLSGEASFDVAKDSILKFRVQSSELQVSVLGTSFHVKARPGQDLQSIDVWTGKVLVSKLGQFEHKIVAEDRLVYSTKTKETSFSKVKPKNIEEFEPGVIQLRNSSLEDICDEFYNCFGIKLIDQEPSNSPHLYNMTIRMNRGPKATLEQIAIVTNRQLKKVNDHYILY